MTAPEPSMNSKEPQWDPPFSAFIAWFDSPEQTALAHDPGEAAPCPICGSPIGDRRRAKNVSLMPFDRRNRCYAYFMHAWCAEDKTTRALLDEEIMAWADRRDAH